MLAEKPDLIALLGNYGDLSLKGSYETFDLLMEELHPLLSRVPSYILPGD